MHAAAAGHSTRGIPKSVGKEFSDADRPGKLPKRITSKPHSPDGDPSFHRASDRSASHADGSTGHAQHMAARSAAHETPHGKRIQAAHKGGDADSSIAHGPGHMLDDDEDTHG